MEKEYKLTNVFDFSNGMPIDRSKIDQWREDVLMELQKDGCNVWYISSGNSLVFGTKRTGTVEIIIRVITKGYVEFIYDSTS